MSASIGGVSCTFVRGTLPAQRERCELWEIPGLDGYGVALLGKADSETELVAVLVSTNAAVNTWIASLQLLQGTIASVTNDHGDTYAYCLLRKVGNARKTPAYVPGTAVTTRGEVPIVAVML